jgi:transposase, IS5 family
MRGCSTAPARPGAARQGSSIKLRQSYVRVGKFAPIDHQRHAHAKQFKRGNRALKTLRTYLGRIIRDIARKIEGTAAVLSGSALGRMLALARQVLDQRQTPARTKGVLAAHTGGGVRRQGHRPYEFGASTVATTLAQAKGGQFVTHVKALPGNPGACPRGGRRSNPRDGHTLATGIPEMEAPIGNTIEHILADKGCHGHNAPPDQCTSQGRSGG